MEMLQKTPNSRIINVSSLAHKMGDIDFNDLNWRQRKYKKWKAYGDSKLANLYFTFALSNRLAKGHPIVAAAHPGWTATELQRHTPLTAAMNHLFAQDTVMGALPSLYAALGPEVENAEKLWQISEELTNVRFEALQ